MKNKFITIIIAFITIFFSQSQVWASSENIKVQTQFNSLQIDKSVFLSNDDSPAVIAKRVGDVKEQSSWWIASIFIAGLGQIMMGDFWRGFNVILNVYGVLIIGALIGSALGFLAILFSMGGGNPLATLLFVASGLIILATLVYTTISYVLNIIDAHKMSQEQDGISKLKDQDIAKLEEDLKSAMDFTNSVKVSDNGAVSLRALAF